MQMDNEISDLIDRQADSQSKYSTSFKDQSVLSQVDICTHILLI